jgi:hypothetical protein
MIGDRALERNLARLLPNDGENRTIIELRCKLEMRSLFLRASVALNTALIAGFVIQVARHFGAF